MLLVALSLLAVVAAEEMVVLSGPPPSISPRPDDPALATVRQGYFENFGIPEAQRILEEESRPGTRVAGGLGSYLGEHKFFAGLLITLTTGQTAVCGGSLISSSRVLTSATCWYDGQYQGRSVLVVLGSVYLFSGGTRISATAIAVHPNYNSYWLMSNLAVLWIPPVASTNYIRPIALATDNLTFTGYTAEIIGFGKTSDGSSITNSQSLRDAFVTVITNAVCKDTYGVLIEPEHICTSGAGGRSACGGDQGGPLILYSSAGNDVLIGVVAFWSANGCSSYRPTGHTRVAHHLSWIRAQM